VAQSHDSSSVGPVRGVDLDVHREVAQQRVDPGEEQDEGQVARRRRWLAHLASAISGSGKEQGGKGLDLRAGASGYGHIGRARFWGPDDSVRLDQFGFEW
jgi:hypothetical protein